MWVICIDVEFSGIDGEILQKPIKNSLTKGKKYLIQNLTPHAVYLITNDFGEDVYYEARRFISVEEHRETILNIICG